MTDSWLARARAAPRTYLARGSGHAFDEVEVDADEVESVEEAHSRAHVNCLAALADGRLASGSSDHSIIIWNLADGKQLATLDGHEGGHLAALEVLLRRA